jgi:hypothetical protein
MVSAQYQPGDRHPVRALTLRRLDQIGLARHVIISASWLVCFMSFAIARRASMASAP